MKKIKTGMRIVPFMVVNRVFAAFCKLKESRVLFASDVRAEIGGNLKAVCDYLPETYDKAFDFKEDRRKKRTFAAYLRLAYNLAVSKYIILEDFLDYTAFMKVRKDQEICQLWHGAGAYKKFAYSRQANQNEKIKIHSGYKRYTRAIVSAEEIRGCYAEAFQITMDKVQATGIPRTDVFFDRAYIEEKKKKLYASYPALAGKKVILFAPTYRGTHINDAGYDFDRLNLDKLYAQLKDEYVFVFKWHPAAYNNLIRNGADAYNLEQYEGFFQDLSMMRDINDLLLITDVLVTDYSSVIFDYLLVDKPIVYYIDPDEHYEDNRGIYYSFEDYLYGPVAENQEMLIEAIKQGSMDDEKRQRFHERFMAACDGNSTKKTCEWIFGAKMMNKKRYDIWCSSEHLSKQEREELKTLSEAEIKERFHSYLEFGTAGMRGRMGMGTNRMNRYTVRRATKGLAEFLLGETQEAKEKGVAIAYDTRKQSKAFAEETAHVLSQAGITAHLFDSASPVPLLSFAIRQLGCAAGVAITASHNTKEYNGYKVYNEKGCQLVPAVAERLSACVNRTEDAFSFPEKATSAGTINKIGTEMSEQFIDTIQQLSCLDSVDSKRSLRVVYTPLHGTGSPFVETVLQKDGFSVSLVKEQMQPEGGEFPTVKQPNPEDTKALDMAVKQAEGENADLIIGTDPDCDRIGVVVRHEGAYQVVTSNQIGGLLVDFFAETRKIGETCTMVKTVVTSELGADVAKEKGIKVIDTLPGFKYIGEKMEQISEFLFGYEESCGFLVGDHARDKDGVSAAMMVCEMAAYYKSKNMTLVDAVNCIYKENGYYLDTQESFVFEGIEGSQKMQGIMQTLRTEGLDGIGEITEVQDYLKNFKDFPETNMIKYILKNDSWMAIRPSGTEPKIKIYYSVKMRDRAEAEQYFSVLQKAVREKIKI